MDIVFDQHQGSGALDFLFNSLKANELLWWGKHLGKISFPTMRAHAELQAADVLANESKKEKTRGEHKQRRLMKRLEKTVHDFPFTPELFGQFETDLIGANPDLKPR